MIPVALTIAGSDSGGGAGIQADLKTFAALGVFGTSAITAITAQNTVGVEAVQVLPPEMVVAQIRAVAGDLPVAAAKTGMLAEAAIIEAVASIVRELKLGPLVVDPVMVAKSGHRLLAPDAELALRKILIPVAFLITPNIPEAEVLTGMTIANPEAMKTAAQKLFELGSNHVLIKGGHLRQGEAIDFLYDGQNFQEFRSPRIATRSTHGTGCTLSAAITAYLAQGVALPEACAKAKSYLTGALQHAIPLGSGHGPVNHLWQQPFSFGSGNRK
ncbi:MAG: bifunctional hydroxymethylpyrimidine kinase/phosphomethylpyrimidine kinase [Turneriella sp.]|nr:bifunctional hydroxymethylpyrimidine kinase/phosphomethylpyrimidine kinase [Turneriella sp.]